MVENIKILRIESKLNLINNGQIAVEDSVDTDLDFIMWGGKDYAGDITKFLAKNKKGSLDTLNLIGSSTIGGDGLIRHDTNGLLSGGLITIAELNNLISDYDITSYWNRDIVSTPYIEPITPSDVLRVGDGDEDFPSYGFENGPDYGMFYDNIGDYIAFTNGGTRSLEIESLGNDLYLRHGAELDSIFLMSTSSVSNTLVAPYALTTLVDGNATFLAVAQTNGTGTALAGLSAQGEDTYGKIVLEAQSNFGDDSLILEGGVFSLELLDIDILSLYYSDGTVQFIFEHDATIGTSRSEAVAIELFAISSLSTAQIHLVADDNSPLGVVELFLDNQFTMSDQSRNGSTWSSRGIDLSASSSEWNDIEVLLGSEGSLFAAILAASLNVESHVSSHEKGGSDVLNEFYNADPSSGNNSGIVEEINIVTNPGIGKLVGPVGGSSNYAGVRADSITTMPATHIVLESGTGIKKALAIGLYNNNTGATLPGGTGDDLYVSATVAGDFVLSASKPTGSGHIVQKIGSYKAGGNVVRFRPSQTFIELV